MIGGTQLIWSEWWASLPGNANVLVQASGPGRRAFSGAPVQKERSEDWLDLRPWEVGDPLNELRPIDFLVRKEKVRRIYRAELPGSMTIIVDSSPVLGGVRATAVGAIHLAMGWAVMGLKAGAEVHLYLKGTKEAGQVFHGVQELQSHSCESVWLWRDSLGDDAAADLARVCGHARSNHGLAWITHAARPVEKMKSMLDVLSRYPWPSLVVPMVAESDFRLGREARDPLTGDIVPIGRDAAASMAHILDDLVDLGVASGIRIRPLVVDRPEEDVRSTLESGR